MEQVEIDYDEMVAGRELDALVAERVMGRSVYGGPVPQDDVQLIDEGSWCFVEGYGMQPTTETCPRYSSNIADAWQVVGRFDSYHLDWNELDKLHECRLLHYKLDAFGYARTETAPLAICRAALMAVSPRSPSG